MPTVATIECPANYFGRGKDYVLPDDPEVIREFEKRFEKWEREHPDDPTGEQALKKKPPQVIHKQFNNRSTKGTFVPKNPIISEPKVPFSVESLMGEIKLRLPIRELEMLKNYAIFKRRRPRDIILKLVQENCNINS